ncbi:Branched-chain amino acid transport protein [Thermanaeromonas toyohensis ToBE]|uniref:Branched-chain amino acid transport protein n=1 Tax=Thermanaeromonas toyohensis ToBE TaxID=698762 RepID=A0A1W1VNK6_9FIRM|nr:AzlD domain-containing protein [Thermanaeromonas toyohensis]SMB94937.1 Branched-chain amino acid transport protein [Thermanaeromonas toyohensis ToBE]
MDRQILLVILGMALVTYLPRMLPLVLLSRTQLPNIFLRWLSYIPAAVLAALLAPALFLPEGKFALVGNPYLLAAIPTSLIAIRTRSIALTILCGMAAMVLLNYI